MSKYVKIDGVDINKEWVSKMSKNQFINHPQVVGLFYRIKPEDRAAALSTIYETITGKKSRNGGNAPAPVVESNDAPADNPSIAISE